MKSIGDILYDISINSIKANATKIEVNIHYLNHTLYFEIIDNGDGINDLSNIFEYNSKSFGIKNAKEVCELCGGNLLIERDKMTKIKMSFDLVNFNCLPYGNVCEKLYMLKTNLEVSIRFWCDDFDKKIVLTNKESAIFFDDCILLYVNQYLSKENVNGKIIRRY